MIGVGSEVNVTDLTCLDYNPNNTFVVVKTFADEIGNSGIANAFDDVYQCDHKVNTVFDGRFVENSRQKNQNIFYS